MHPKQFIETWGMGREEFAELVGRSMDTVNHWLLDAGSPSYRKPPNDVEQFLSLVNLTWSMRRLIDRDVPERVTRYYDEVISRRDRPTE